MNAPELSRMVVPPGGFSYDQPLADSSYTRIEGASLDQIQERVLRYRQVNGMLLPPGTLVTPEAVWSDYHAQVCGKYPWLCSPAREPMPMTVETRTGATGFEMLITRMQRWIDQIRVQPIEWTDQKTASDRSNICMACPANVAWETSCGSCNLNLIQASAAVRGARRLAADQALRGCRSFGTLMELAVWISDPRGERKYAPPPQCWRGG